MERIGMMLGGAGWKSRDTAILVALAAAGLAYFGQYYDCGFNIGDEGSVVVVTERLLQGERPFVDVFLGYGLLWFYPLVVLFKITGVNFIGVRLYFLSLALVTSLLGFLAVRRFTHHRGIAIAVAVLLMAVPGTLHKAYIPLIVIGNMLCLPSLSRHQRIFGGSKIFGAGLVAAVSYHIRPDLGLIAGLVLIAVLSAHTMSRGSSWQARIFQLGRLVLLVGLAGLVPTLPLLIVAQSQGFVGPFLEVLFQPIRFLSESMATALGALGNFTLGFLQAPAAFAAPAQSTDSGALEEAGRTLARIPWAAVWEPGPRRGLALLTYMPLFSLGMTVAYVLYLMLRRALRSRSIVADDSVGLLALLGLAYSAFPQFFLFRPDVAHLSQFMPGFTVLVGVCLGRWLRPIGDRVPTGSSWQNWWLRLSLSLRWIASGLFVLHVGIYSWHAFHRPPTGSIAMAWGRTERFQGANGVDVTVSRHEQKLFTEVARIVEESSRDDEAVLCLPYCPGFNVLANRKTFGRRLYVDDGMLSLDPDWQLRTIERLKAEQVPLIIVRNGAINGTEISRVKNWATDLMDHVLMCYEHVDRFWGNEFYRRPGSTATESEETDEACLDKTKEKTDSYLRSLDVAGFERRGSDFSSPLFDPRRLAGQLGRNVEELVSGVDYDFERLEEVERRLGGVDRERVLAAIFDQVTQGASSNTERHVAVADFLAKAMTRGPLNPTYRESFLSTVTTRRTSSTRVEDPLVLLELGEGGSGQVSALAVDLWRAAGLEARQVQLGRHTVAELHYDGEWHYFDAAIFGGAEIVKDSDGTVPSLAELSRMPLAIDRLASHVEPVSGGRLNGWSPKYPSYDYFGACPDCGGPKTYRYKIGSREQQALDLRFGWRAALTRQEEAKDIVVSGIPARFQPGAPYVVGVYIKTENSFAVVEIRWLRSSDQDGDLVGYRVYASEQSRGWSYATTGAERSVLAYWSHPDGWEPSMHDRLFELPKSEVALITTEAEEVRLELEMGQTYYVTVMPFDAHGESVGRELYRPSQELKISL